jgi:hypothetical protein
MGHKWNVHSDLPLVAMLILATGVWALVIELIALFAAVSRVRHSHAPRERIDYLCMAFASAYIAACMFTVVWISQEMSK